MADGENERLGSSSKKHTKYGTTTKSMYTNERFYKYNINPGDTLQGIALKLSVTMADIKRANNMWTNDSLYLRNYLLIPISAEYQANGFASLTTENSKTEGDLEVVTRQDLSMNKMSKSQSCSGSLASTCECGKQPPPSESTDFLSRFDSNLAKIKSSVEKIEQKSGATEDSSNPLHLLPKKRTLYSSKPGRSSFDSNMRRFSDESTSEPDLVIFSRNGNNSQVQSSLDQIQKTDDELFQL